MTSSASPQSRRIVQVGSAQVAVHDVGTGRPLLLLHGCPFASFIWRKVVPTLTAHYRCVSPDLLGLGDTETPPDADWSLPAQARMIISLLDALGIRRADVIGHDHGGAVAQLLAADHPERVDRLVLCNAEAYDNWPSAEERPFVAVTRIPLLGDLALRMWAWKPLLRATLSEARAVSDRSALTEEMLDAYVRANFATRHRRWKTRRFLAAQFDPANNRVTSDLIPRLRHFDHPTLLLWGADDPHFGPPWAERLRDDIPGATRLELLEAGHLLMEERPVEFAEAVLRFLEQE